MLASMQVSRTYYSQTLQLNHVKCSYCYQKADSAMPVTSCDVKFSRRFIAYGLSYNQSSTYIAYVCLSVCLHSVCHGHRIGPKSASVVK